MNSEGLTNGIWYTNSQANFRARDLYALFQICKNAVLMLCDILQSVKLSLHQWIQIDDASYQKSIPRSNFRWKAVLTAYKIKITGISHLSRPTLKSSAQKKNGAFSHT